jgi:hypothetical protein
LRFWVTKVTTTAATHNPRPPTNIPSQGRRPHHVPLPLPDPVPVPVMAVFVVAAAAAVCVMSRSLLGGRRGEPSCQREWRVGGRVSSTPAAILPACWLESRATCLLSLGLRAAGAKLFLLVDHSGGAQRVGMVPRDTKLLVFGNPVGGTPAMVASPLAATPGKAAGATTGVRSYHGPSLSRAGSFALVAWPGRRTLPEADARDG